LTSSPVDYGGGAREGIAGLLAAAAIFVGFVALAWHPFRMGTAAILLALVAAAMGGRHQRLAGIAVAIAASCWFFGMVIAAVASKSLY
jgi:hypothetical protein